MEIALRVRTEVDELGKERPLAFFVEEKEVVVEEIIDRWYDECANYYKVIGDDEVPYLLRHNLESAAWELVESTDADAEPPNDQ